MKNEEIKYEEVNLDMDNGKEELNTKCWNLENKEDIEELKERVGSGSLFFRVEEDITYKVKLTSPQVKEIVTKFVNEAGEPIIKYELSITAKGSDKSEFEGVWQVGIGVLNTIMKNYEQDAIFNVSKSGKGINTKYSINKDF